ncbi:MAG: flavin monoamine oxidase family protein [Planctomycetota bacterium]
MAHCSHFRTLQRHWRIAELANRLGWSSSEAVDFAANQRQQKPVPQPTRRRFLGHVGSAMTATAAAGALGPIGTLTAAPRQPSSISVGIVGAGLAGLMAARQLTRAGCKVTLYEASQSLGGRVSSDRETFPGQVAELGGELIDNLHKTMLGLAQEFDLAIEDVNKVDGDVYYHFFGQDYSETAVVDEFRQFVPIMKDDVRRLSGTISANGFTSNDRRQDLISLQSYLDGNNSGRTPASPLIREVIRVAYTIEYGLDAFEQSSINFLHFIHADNRSEFQPWGLVSDDRHHIVGGNHQIVTRLAEELAPSIQLGRLLTRVSRRSDGSIQLDFASGKSASRVHDRVILAIPFTTLRRVELAANLSLPLWKRDVIAKFSLGANSKQMVGFRGRPWAEQGSNGASYSDLDHLQCTWETNAARSSPQQAILTNFTGGLAAVAVNSDRPQQEAAMFLADLEQVFSGASSRAIVDGRNYRTVVANWAHNPLARGGYTCYRPGDFTTLAGLEGLPIGNLHFAGEHTDSFYSWQGFMEGACLSGLRAAEEVLKVL